MKSILSFFLFFAIFLITSAQDFPPGATDMIADAVSNFSRVGSQGTVRLVDADHPQFNKAIEVNVTSQPDNYWNFQVQFKTVEALEKGDVCLVSLWARCTHSKSESGEGLFTAIIEHNQTYQKPLSKTFVAGGEWVHFYYPFVADMDLPLDKIRAAIFFGYAVQTIEIADIHYWNYKKTISIDSLPQMKVYYPGMEPDAPWRAEAEARIEKFRKGNVIVKLVDSGGNPVQGIPVSLTMKKHKFGFGTAIDGKTYNNNATYRNHIHELFNEVVFENDLKWKPWVASPSHSYITTAINTLTGNGISIRGHNLIWPGWDYLPSFMELYKNDAERLKSECINHIEEVATFTKGKLVDWDVLNEPYTNHVIQDITGDEVMADWFKKAKEVDPQAKRYINDYSILSNGGTDNKHQDGYFNIIQYIDEHGGEIQGIGMQGHFSEFVTGIPKVISILDRFATFNKEIKITEFDINTSNDSLKVQYTRDFMTAVFSHPYVKSILCWGFWAGRHWRPEAAYYNLDWSIRPQGEMYKKLVFDTWWTRPQSLVSGTLGEADFGSCFLGSYEIELLYNGKKIVKSVNIDFNRENEIIIDVENETVSVSGEVHDDTPVFTSARNSETNRAGKLLIYPNPATSRIHIETTGIENRESIIEIYNTAGKCLLAAEIGGYSGKITLPLNLEPGIYLIVLSNEQQRTTEKLVVR